MWGLNTDRFEDRGGRRSGLDRRSVFTPSRIREKRSWQDRRMGQDRRIGKEDLVVIFKPKRKTDEFVEIPRSVRDFIEGICISLLLLGAIIISIDHIFERIIIASIGALK